MFSLPVVVNIRINNDGAEPAPPHHPLCGNPALWLGARACPQRLLQNKLYFKRHPTFPLLANALYQLIENAVAMAPKQRSQISSSSSVPPIPKSPSTTSTSKPSSASSSSSNQSAQEILLGSWNNYLNTTPQRVKLIDVFMAFLVVVGGLQFLYCVIVGNYVSYFLLGSLACNSEEKETAGIDWHFGVTGHEG